ncbi:class I SAM-dependent methyltransferase [Shinella zoogloeoides]
MLEGDRLCIACGSKTFIPLAIPHPSRSMVSDGSLVGRALVRLSCAACGHGSHLSPPTQEDLVDIYGKNYSLGLYDPKAERDRSLEYGRQLRSFLEAELGGLPIVGSIVEFGCGSGTLLGSLFKDFGARHATGIEPSSRLVAYARSNVEEEIEIHQGFAEWFDGTQYDLCVSVNVIEHAQHPAAFLAASHRCVQPNGYILIVCPDGEIVSSELLFYDHISSFTMQSLRLLARANGLALVGSRPLSDNLHGFRAYLFRRGEDDCESLSPDAAGLAEERSEYLSAWGQFENILGREIEGDAYAVFGTGEYADLLYAYSPSVIARAAYFVCDRPTADSRNGKRIVTTDEFLASRPLPVVAAVHERNWFAVRDRFLSKGVSIMHPYELAREGRLL